MSYRGIPDNSICIWTTLIQPLCLFPSHFIWKQQLYHVNIMKSFSGSDDFSLSTLVFYAEIKKNTLGEGICNV